MFSIKLDARTELKILQEEHAGELFALVDKNRMLAEEWSNKA